MKELYFKSREEWSDWLKQNHRISNGLWLVFYKTITKKETMNYDDAVEEALCFGWIDSVIKKRNEEYYVRKFTPRKPNSKWSELNRRRVEKLIKDELMQAEGFKKVDEAKTSGMWDKPDRPEISLDISEDFSEALKANPKAENFFHDLTPSYKKQFMGWINSAKRMETREKRIQESILILEQNKKLGMK